MAVSTDWQETRYNETFEEETRLLARRRQSDPTCTISGLQGILDALYIADGSDQNGRGSLQDTIMAATIAAYERFIAQWKAESEKS